MKSLGSFKVVRQAVQVLRFASVMVLILGFLLVSLSLNFTFFSQWKRQRLRTKAMSVFCDWGLKVIGIQSDSFGWSGANGQCFSSPQLFVCNHMSYLDILVLSALYPTSYVTSYEIKELPGLGLMTQLAGCLYVERRSRENLSQEISELTQALKQNLNVTVFPEATSTNGEEILRFKSPLYQAAIDAQVSIQPLCLNYVKIGESCFSKANRDLVCWYGDMDFIPHLWKLCGVGRVQANVYFLNPLVPKALDLPKELAFKTQVQVSKYFQPAL